MRTVKESALCFVEVIQLLGSVQLERSVRYPVRGLSSSALNCAIPLCRIVWKERAAIGASMNLSVRMQET